VDEPNPVGQTQSPDGQVKEQSVPEQVLTALSGKVHEAVAWLTAVKPVGSTTSRIDERACGRR
jgi:hypothetical protein